MNGEMDSTTPDPVWDQDGMLKLLDAMKGNLPEKDLAKYKTSESHLDWEKVAFNPYSADMCKQKWQEVSREIRKFRTLSELIVDAQDFVKNPYKGKKLKKHPDFPKKPLTPYFRFFMEKRAKYAKLHPEMSNLDLTKILSKKYKELPERKKEKYVNDFLQEKGEFVHSMNKFREDHPDLLENLNKKSNVPEKAKTPQQLWYCHEKKAFLKLHPDATTKDIKDNFGKQWMHLSDKKKIKWIVKSLELQKQYEETMREFIQQHPEMNMKEENFLKSTLTKAERQLKDKFDGRPDKPPSNGYSMFCAELMSGMKDVPSTERMVMCSHRWKLLKQNEKDAYQKRCEQRKKEYEVKMNSYLLSISEEEQHRILSEQKMGSFKRAGGSPAPKKNSKASLEKPKPPVSAMFIFAEEKRPKLHQERPDLSDMELTRLLARMWSDLSDKKKEKYKNLEMTLRANSEKQLKEDKGKLPETPKTAQEIWQQSVIGDYLARFKGDRAKAQKTMEATWNTMEKKEKIVWIKKAAEDQKRYERELSEMRSPAPVFTPGKKIKFEGEPKKPPSNGYQKFSQEMLSNGELNHLPMKERMGEIGGRWQRLLQKEKDRYKKLAEEKQRQYKVLLEQWLESLSTYERAAYKEYNSMKRRSTGKQGGTNAKVAAKAKQPVSVKTQKKVVVVEEEEDDDDDEDNDDREKDSDEGSSSGDDSDDDDEDDDEDDNDDNEDVEDEVDDKENKSESSSSASSSDDSSGSDSD
ncbi:nucleolar transcription factor 1 isoform X1 [Triplophysa dalaica]|uniref:nucleolar transcription factor 1 isoform X1 n=1 Tax=Triplophysa dalaica TaxID=1582913 RepID=UPI0024DF468F|nr:nucleolar transcription factor 1 isoform X1 [Triplophysa dalaica]XP_056607844.1 nucleolar transcription factor 1 isoform X1 [Triplophysa dalaica]XP_056607845.1 nucleolar transcription factor 1 isoform X1 [Triplophysa dalaica]XP_056607846.1 nucleolar transcription factor 1 isoform X1 [Triplophysa dalaica]XP_056607847.1 nucleolar transcription factor 1 isoform X1 [Triplophysa dalaica]